MQRNWFYMHLSSFDMQGKSIKQQTHANKNRAVTLDIDLSEQKGQYIVRISQGKEVISKKIIVL